MIFVEAPTRLGGVLELYSSNLVDQVVELLTKVGTYVTLGELSSILGAPANEVSSAIEKIRAQRHIALSSAPGPVGRGGYAVVKGKESDEYNFTRNWIKNWRKAKNIEPPDSAVL